MIMDAERLVKFSRDNISAERRSPGRPKNRRSDLIPGTTYKEKKKKKNKKVMLLSCTVYSESTSILLTTCQDRTLNCFYTPICNPQELPPLQDFGF